MARQVNYLRVSSPGQEENYSLPEQERDCNRYGETEGNEILDTYNDGAQRSYTLNRPGLNKLMQDARHGLFDVVVVGKFDRFSRVQSQQAVAIYQLEQYGVRVISASEPVPEGAIGTFMRNSYAFAAELELYKIRDRVNGGKKARLRDGKLLASPFPLYGYSWANPNAKRGKDAYLIDPETSWVVELIFRLVVAGRSLRSIGKELEARGIPTPGQILEKRGQLPRGHTCGPIWRGCTLRRVLTNPAYMGKYSGWRRVKEETKQLDKITGEMKIVTRVRELDADDPERVFLPESACPAIVDEGAFQAVQAILQRNRTESPRNIVDPEAALLRNGFAICGHCDRFLRAKFYRQEDLYYYRCHVQDQEQSAMCPSRGRSMRAGKLDQAAWNWIIKTFEEPDLIRAAYERWKSGEVEGRSYEYDRLSQLAELTEQARARWQNCLSSAAEAKDEENRVEFTRMADDARTAMRGYQQEHDKLTHVLTNQDSAGAFIENLIAMGSRALDWLRAANYQDRRMVLHSLGFKIHVKTVTDWRVTWRLGEIIQQWAEEPHDSFVVPSIDETTRAGR